MGAAGAVQFGVETGGETASRHVFPSYRFPESAARALSRAVQYAAFRTRTGGRFLWYEDVDPATARQEVKAMVDAAGEDVIWLDGEPAWKLLRYFGIHPAAPEAAREMINTERATLEVRSDPSFGPLIRILRNGHPPVVRITPLTDHDVQEILEAAEIPGECGVEELLGRISQLIEELPWLCGMEAVIHRVEHPPDQCRVVLGQGVRLGFSH